MTDLIGREHDDSLAQTAERRYWRNRLEYTVVDADSLADGSAHWLDGLPAVLALWEDARARGWDVEPDPQSHGWRLSAPQRTEGMSYDPPGPVSTGVVGAFDEHRTLALTGTDARQAVAALRGFFNWPATVDTAGCPCGSPATGSDAAGDCCADCSASGGDR